MCSINDAEFDSIEQCMEQKPPVTTIGSICKKCNERRADIVLRIRDAYCRECFLTAATHKFRASLGKSKLVRPQDHVLIAFSGSQPSVALLHLVNAGLNEANHKRLLFTCSVVYIDEGNILGLSLEERKTVCTSIVVHVGKLNLPLYIASLEDCTEDSDVRLYSCSDEVYDVHSKNEECMKKLMSSVHSLTAKEDLLQKIRNRLLLKIAKQLKCTKIFTAETANHLAVKILSNVSVGRGAQLPLDVGFCDNRDPGVMLLRPMRDFMKKEVVFYNAFNKIVSIAVPSLGTKAGSHASIQKLTEKFVTDLQEDFPSTVSTIFRTGDKLSLGTNETDEDNYCVLCQAPLDTTVSGSSALQATEFSRKVSALGPSGFDSRTIGTLQNDLSRSKENAQEVLKSSDTETDSTQCCNTSTPIVDKNSECCRTGEDCQCSRNNKSVTLPELEVCLCYGCRLIAREMDTPELLPAEVISKAKQRLSYKAMRKEIEDFLL
ncbi:cytoplasmic tRNA 2-thiolation protein 2-B [Periplaneta americana]|uniref:cytoplasmic tRNA 2-thiolation protein 2-B n=1 Tax=Periplaneta americana TaxID=6978 RepID=UPI0037E76C78